jgi:hypothetical protein
MAAFKTICAAFIAFAFRAGQLPATDLLLLLLLLLLQNADLRCCG